MAQTRRQQRFSDRVRAHSAKVTSYTTTYSSAVITVSCSALNSSLMSLAVTGDIFRRNISERSASSRLTKQRRPKLTSISFTPTWKLGFTSCPPYAGRICSTVTCLDLAMNLLTAVPCCRLLDMLRPPLRVALLVLAAAAEVWRTALPEYMVCLEVSGALACSWDTFSGYCWDTLELFATGDRYLPEIRRKNVFRTDLLVSCALPVRPLVDHRAVGTGQPAAYAPVRVQHVLQHVWSPLSPASVKTRPSRRDSL